jgi:CubicO group peptidase (beta-lactamase class C family)
MRRAAMLLTALLALVGLAGLTGCGNSGDRASGVALDAGSGPDTTVSLPSSVPPMSTTTVKVYGPDAFGPTDALLAERVSSAGLSGGMVRIVRGDGSVVHDHSVGSVTGSTVLSVASSTKWLTAATLMTFVDDGSIGLDDDIGRWLPEFAGNSPPVTARQLMDHTSGVRDNTCQSNGSPLASCVRAIAAAPRQFPAGSEFSYGNSDFLVVGRLVEVLGGADFAAIAQHRLTGPLGMTTTTWPGSPTAANTAFGVRVTVDDYGRFLDMVLHLGMSGGTRVLSDAAVQSMIHDQVAAYDVTHDFSVGITTIPRYGFGCWPDVVNAFTATRVVSGNGGMGLYPWVDFDTNTWGIVGVQDERGAQLAVPASQRVEIEARAAVAR